MHLKAMQSFLLRKLFLRESRLAPFSEFEG
jgi:hypothetical protein